MIHGRSNVKEVEVCDVTKEVGSTADWKIFNARKRSGYLRLSLRRRSMCAILSSSHFFVGSDRQTVSSCV